VTDLTLGRKGGRDVVSPLDPDWSPDKAAGAVAVPPSTHAPASVPDPGASPFSSAATTVPAPAPAAAPTGSAVIMPYTTPVGEPPAPAVPDVPVQSDGADRAAAGVGEASARAAIEEDSSFEAGLLTELLVEVLEKGASDLHITAGARPTIRLHGSLGQLEERPILTPPVIQRMMYAILTQRQREKFEEELELDFAYAVPGKARFRVNLYRQRDALGAAFRLIPYEIKALEDLGIPPAISNFAMLPRGFVLVTGPTGSGKSTTLASLVDLANRNRRDHIMTVEDPIEFLHRHKSCLVNQREVGEDTWSFQNALKHVLRQDPDIILVGEMRDLETISVALTAAETGHLVFATLHTQDAAQTIDRVIDVFPPHQQQQVRVQLAGALQGVVCQTLAKSVDGQSRVVATEVLTATPAIRNLIREGKTHQIYSALQAGGRHGMHTMDQHLSELVKAGKITYDTGLEKCHHVEDFNRLCGRA
jgi:twitching motility protein PilT